MKTDSKTLQTALDYLSRGWRVIPVHRPLPGGKCSCGREDCGKPGKHPCPKAWQKADTAMGEKELRSWWNRDPSFNVGICTGTLSGGLLYLDIDQHSQDADGRKALADLEKRFGKLPETLTQRTGGGGEGRLFLASPEDLAKIKNRAGAASIAPGLDLRVTGGQFVAPPSLHTSGKRYEWVNPKTPVAKAPEWFVKLCIDRCGGQEKPTTPAVSHVRHSTVPAQDNGDHKRNYCIAALEKACDAVRAAPPGGRNNTLNDQSYGIGQIVAAGGLDQGEAEEALISAAEGAGLTRGEAGATVRSGLSSGLKSPRDLSDVGKGSRNTPEHGTTTKPQPETTAKKRPAEGPGGKPNDAETIINTLLNDFEFFKCDGQVWATVPISGVKQNMPVKSSWFRNVIRSESLKLLGKHVGDETTKKVAGNIEAITTCGDNPAPEKPIFVRVGNHEGKIYFDLADDLWRVVEIDSSGWRVIQDPPVKFRRAHGMKPLPVPITGGKIEDLRPLINAFNEEAWILSVAWLIGALHPTGPYPILIFQGEQGTAKTTMSTLMRDLIDPSKASLRTVPREGNDILIAANNGLIVAFDNLSGIPDWLSDLFCRISTGGGFSARQLYTDNDEIIINVKRPQILNGIDDVAHRGDLRDRSLIINLDPIPDDKRREEDEIMDDYNRLRPGIMGAIFTAVSTALRDRTKKKTRGLPRMADFAAWVNAAEPSLPWEEGLFLKTYRETAHTAIEAALEGSPVAGAIRRILDKRSIWNGRVSELLEEMNAVTPETVKFAKSWPKDSTRLSKSLRRIATEFRRVGIEVSINRDMKGSHVLLKKMTLSKATEKDSVGIYDTDENLENVVEPAFDWGDEG